MSAPFDTDALVFGKVLTRDNPPLSRVKNRALGDDIGGAENTSEYIRASLSENTRRAYQFDLACFFDWGGLLPASPDVVARYLADKADELAPATLSRRIATLGRAHVANGWENPCLSELVRSTLRGIKRVKGTNQKQAKPLLREDLFLVLDALADGIIDHRDRALLLIGWAGGFRASELVGLRLEDVEHVREGLILHLRKSKTDQLSKGRKLGIPLGRTRHCPVSALLKWIDVLAVDEGPLFRPVDRHGRIGSRILRGDAVSSVLRARMEAAGLNADGFSGHSLRSGLVTSAISQGISSYKIRAQTGHASDAMLDRYIRDQEIFAGNALSYLL